MAITLDTARAMVRNSLRSTSGSPEAPVVDRAIKVACDTLIIETDVTRTDGEVTLTAYTHSVSLSSLTTFQVDRLIRAEIRGNDQGTWATATSYTKYDIVRGDGDPDSKLYRCTVAHTSSSSNEPGSSGGSDVWTRVNWDRIEDLSEESYAFIADKLNNEVQDGLPSHIGFTSDSEAVLWPVPDSAFTLGIIYKQSLIEFDDGAKLPGNITLNIPDEYLRPTLWWGASACATHADPGDVFQDSRWRRFMDFVFKVKGKNRHGPRSIRKIESAYGD